ncbi:O-antigen/teichoic acid export membrane protein [Mumia flava]|uniref:O-antigen/teichoic acid export membrane protein n=1 Tax=Mumia flava TaxID=1348852 RepID=A0A2M9BFZ9_9ACTN|nr:hypothetical protein [Mumia flava]PJJ56862.1 O-antigen/teichoic acid export membrane protein [Mumia flava]
MSAGRHRAPTRLENGGYALLRRLGWGIGDQAVSSLSNFVLGIVVARSLGSEDFGAFSLAYLTYGVVINASRGLATDPLVVRHSGRTPGELRPAIASATGTALVVGVVCGIACAGVALVAPEAVGPAFLALAVGLPGLMLQDAWRFAFFASGKPQKAFVNDLVWGVVLIGTLVALHSVGRLTVETSVLAFGGTATLAALFGLLQSRVLPRVSTFWRWMVDHRDLGTRYLLENLSMGFARQLRFVVLGAVAGLAAVGELRAAEMLMGPFLVILMGLSQVAVPEATHVVRRAPHRLGQFCLGLGAVQGAAAAAWGVAMLLLLPYGLGELLLGDLWEPAAALLPIVVVGLVLGGIEVGATAGVRALGAARRSLFAQLTGSGLYLAGGAAGAYLDGARGSAIGVGLAAAVGVVVWWVQLRRGLTDHLAAQALLSTESPTEERILL